MDERQLRRRLAANLKILRRKKGVTQEKLAKLAGVSAQTIAYIESGRTWASDKTLARLADTLGADAGQFFTPNLSELASGDTLQSQPVAALKNELLSYIDARLASGSG